MTADHKKPTLRWGGVNILNAFWQRGLKNWGSQLFLSTLCPRSIVGRPVSTFLAKETLSGKDESTHTRCWRGLACLKTSRFLKLVTSIISSFSISSWSGTLNMMENMAFTCRCCCNEIKWTLLLSVLLLTSADSRAVGYHLSIEPRINVKSDHMKNHMFLIAPHRVVGYGWTHYL